MRREENSGNRKEILIAVSGLNPQVITETLYYLTTVKRPVRKISEIYAITTAPGKEKIIQTLLAPRTGKFFRFCREYDINPDAIRFGPETIISVYGKDGNLLNDIRTKEDNTALANTILTFIKNKTAEKNTELHCSVAGGRKTMSFYLGCALQFYGRPRDTLSHVLVSPPEFEMVDDFFYKPKKDMVMNVSDRKGKLIKKISSWNSDLIEKGEFRDVGREGYRD